MAVGDQIELRVIAISNGQVELYCTWEENGTRQAKGQTLPSYELVAARVVNGTTRPVRLLIYSADSTEFRFDIPPPGQTHTFNRGQRRKLQVDSSICLVVV